MEILNQERLLEEKRARAVLIEEICFKIGESMNDTLVHKSDEKFFHYGLSIALSIVRGFA